MKRSLIALSVPFLCIGLVNAANTNNALEGNGEAAARAAETIIGINNPPTGVEQVRDAIREAGAALNKEAVDKAAADKAAADQAENDRIEASAASSAGELQIRIEPTRSGDKGGGADIGGGKSERMDFDRVGVDRSNDA